MAGEERTQPGRSGWSSLPIFATMSPVTILVDDLREYPDVELPIKHWCHMASDESFEELHGFAERLGVPRHRFQGDHYDLPPGLRARALALGAERVRSTQLVTRMVGPRGERVRRRRARRAGILEG